MIIELEEHNGKYWCNNSNQWLTNGIPWHIRRVVDELSEDIIGCGVLIPATGGGWNA